MGQKDKNTSPLNVQTLISSPTSLPKCPMLKTQEAAQVVSEALSHKQVSAEAYDLLGFCLPNSKCTGGP